MIIAALGSLSGRKGVSKTCLWHVVPSQMFIWASREKEARNRQMNRETLHFILPQIN